MRRLFPFLLIVIALVIFFVYINPAYTGSIAAAQAEITADNQALTTLSAYTAKENQLLAARNQISASDLTLAGELLPASVNNVQTILDLDNLAASSGLALSSVDVSDNSNASGNSSGVSGIPANQNVGSVDLSLSASGTYQSFRTFLSGIEESARLLDVEDISVKGSATGVYNYDLTIRLYWLH